MLTAAIIIVRFVIDLVFCILLAYKRNTIC